MQDADKCHRKKRKKLAKGIKTIPKIISSSSKLNENKVYIIEVYL